MISQAKTEDLLEIVQIHRKVLPYTINSRVGSKFLHSLYSVLLKNPSSNQVLVYKENQSVLGFASFCTDLNKTNLNVLKHLSLTAYVGILLFLITHPASLGELFSRNKFSNYLENKFKNPYPTILTIGVDPSVQGKGVGKQLMKEVFDYFKKHRISTFYVDTQTSNKGAILFYEKSGFTDQGNFENNKILRFSK